ncbi:transposase [Acetobacter musti]|uniref:Transposase n=1 Tax=Acetobacter musti TaxID=864732 RepID=A0ABX0JPB3_9PROT|nr:transposase [Acetobacter musti]NHN85097.1 transposase [Acetobacter musti]
MEEGDGTGTFTDETWAIWEPLIEAVRPRGKTPPHDLRRTIAAIFWRHELPLAPAMLDNLPAIPAKRRDGPVACPKWACRCRHLVENLWARLREWSAVATRYEKTATSFLAVIYIAAATDWIKP